jgi:hypothetical protein
MKSPEATRITLMARLNAACGFLAGHRHHDSAAAVKEAQEVIRALPFADDINAALYPTGNREAENPLLLGNLDKLRDLRTWHYAQYMDYTARAIEMQKKSDGRLFKSIERCDFERVADSYRAKANQHLRFVQTLNGFFPEKDRVA